MSKEGRRNELKKEGNIPPFRILEGKRGKEKKNGYGFTSTFWFIVGISAFNGFKGKAS